MTQQPLTIYTEMTPNPESLKFVVNQMLLPVGVLEFKQEADAQDLPIAAELFGFPFVKAVFIATNFITITKEPDTEWPEIMPSLKQFVLDFLKSGKEAVPANYRIPGNSTEGEATEEDVVTKIKEILETYIKPAVAQDGGNIVFRGYETGTVQLGLQGACSGCPSSTVTLKAGVEGMLKRMVPEVEEVVAVEE